MEEDYRPEEKFVPPPQDSNRQGEGSSSMSQDQWGWIQTETGVLHTEQTRQGVELF